MFFLGLITGSILGTLLMCIVITGKESEGDENAKK